MIRYAFPLLLMLSACDTTNIEPEAPDGPPGVQMTLSADERRACVADGGTVERAGMLGAERCTRSYSDAGKLCTDSSQCEGQCRNPDLDVPAGSVLNGTCQANDNPFGCYSTVENGQIGQALCVD